MSQLLTFPSFKSLPPEIRTSIWAINANSTRRNIDLWADFVQCERARDKATFYTQKYFCELTDISPPAILHACRESRAVGLKFYTLEYTTRMCGYVIKPTMYINYTTDTLIPRGHWNMISFEHIMSRAFVGGLVRLAVDVLGVFWIENMKMYLQVHNWPGNGIKEIVLYEGERDGMWKGCEYLSKFRSRYTGGQKVLEFEDLEGEPCQNLTEVKEYLDGYFGIIERPEAERPEIENRPRWLTDAESTTPGEFERPEIRFKKLVANSPPSEPTTPVRSSVATSFNSNNSLKVVRFP